jgi:oligoribonuclease
VGGHRALDDIKESLAELVYYRRTVFVPPETPGVPTGVKGVPSHEELPGE